MQNAMADQYSQIFLNFFGNSGLIAYQSDYPVNSAVVTRYCWRFDGYGVEFSPIQRGTQQESYREKKCFE